MRVKRAGTSPVNAVVRDTIVQRQVHFQSSSTRPYRHALRILVKTIWWGSDRVDAERTTLAGTEIESKLLFAGFLVLSCPLKRATKDAIKALRRSNHGLMMITGDHMLTACYVAKEVNVTEKKKKALVLHPGAGGGSGLEWRSLDEKTSMSFSLEVAELDKLADWSLCIGGDALAQIVDTRVIPPPVRTRCALVCTHRTFTKGRSISSRSTEGGPAFSMIVSRATRSQEKCQPS